MALEDDFLGLFGEVVFFIHFEKLIKLLGSGFQIALGALEAPLGTFLLKGTTDLYEILMVISGAFVADLSSLKKPWSGFLEVRELELTALQSHFPRDCRIGVIRQLAINSLCVEDHDRIAFFHCSPLGDQLLDCKIGPNLWVDFYDKGLSRKKTALESNGGLEGLFLNLEFTAIGGW